MKKNKTSYFSFQFYQQQSTQQPTQNISPLTIYDKLVTFVMKKGKKTKAQKVVQEAFHVLAERLPLHSHASISSVVHQSIANVKPVFELRKARLGGSTQYIPAPLIPSKQENIAIRWIVQAAQEKKKKTTQGREKAYGMGYFLGQELLEAFKKQGPAKQRKDEIHKLAEANRALAYQRWW